MAQAERLSWPYPRHVVPSCSLRGVRPKARKDARTSSEGLECAATDMERPAQRLVFGVNESSTYSRRSWLLEAAPSVAKTPSQTTSWPMP